MESRAFRSLRMVGWAAAVLLVAVGVGELLFAGDSLAHRVFFLSVLTLFALLIVTGVRTIAVRPWPGAAMAMIGAVLGGVALFWTGLAIVLAIAIVALSVVCARQFTAAPA